MSNEATLCVCGSEPKLTMESFDREDSPCYECRKCGRSGGKALIEPLALAQWNALQSILRCKYFDTLVTTMEKIVSETCVMGYDSGHSGVHKLASTVLAAIKEK